MLQRIARLAIAAPRRIVAIAILVMVGAAIFGIPVAKSLSAGGFQDPGSESAKATQLLSDKFGQGDMQLLITVSAPAGATSAPARAVAIDIVDHLARSPHVASVTSAWTAPPAAATSPASSPPPAWSTSSRSPRTSRRCPPRAPISTPSCSAGWSSTR